MTIVERWKDVSGSNGRYEISNKGRIWSNIRKGRYLRAFSPGGYCQVSLILKEGERAQIRRIHRLVAEHFICKPKSKTEVNHKDGNKSNNHASNLEWVTPSENHIHAIATGLRQRGEKSCRAKLTEVQAQEALDGTVERGESLAHYARKFGVSRAAILSIKSRCSWKHLSVGGDE